MVAMCGLLSCGEWSEAPQSRSPLWWCPQLQQFTKRTRSSRSESRGLREIRWRLSSVQAMRARRKGGMLGRSHAW